VAAEPAAASATPRHSLGGRQRRLSRSGEGLLHGTHVGLGVSDLEQSKAFYQQALGPLGYQLLTERDGAAGFGRNGKPDFFVHANRPLSGPTHVAIASPDRATVQAFHAAGLAAGGRDDGPPGPRPHYHQDYYGAFVLDPDGNNVEAVCHRPA
jgi:catechol 2,3-dioxygenase-like lactoylglutathione lyase family enzyme